MATITDDREGRLYIDGEVVGDIIYTHGIAIITSGSIANELDTAYNNVTSSYSWKSNQPILVGNYHCKIKNYEFNYSQNPSAVDVTLSGSYDFTTTAINNVKPAGTIKIKEVLDIKRKSLYHGTATGSLTNTQAPIGELGTGSWDDYYESSSVDPTGSYLAPFVTTIGLYDDDNNMIAIAKLPKPIKKLPDYDVNFIVRFDT